MNYSKYQKGKLYMQCIWKVSTTLVPHFVTLHPYFKMEIHSVLIHIHNIAGLVTFYLVFLVFGVLCSFSTQLLPDIGRAWSDPAALLGFLALPHPATTSELFGLNAKCPLSRKLGSSSGQYHRWHTSTCCEDVRSREKWMQSCTESLDDNLLQSAH